MRPPYLFLAMQFQKRLIHVPFRNDADVLVEEEEEEFALSKTSTFVTRGLWRLKGGDFGTYEKSPVSWGHDDILREEEAPVLDDERERRSLLSMKPYCTHSTHTILLLHHQQPPIPQ